MIPYAQKSVWDDVMVVHGLNTMDRHCRIGRVWFRLKPENPMKLWEFCLKAFQNDRPI